MATKLDKCARRINDAFSEKLNAAFLAKFTIELTTSFNIFSMQTISRRADGEDLTPEQMAFVTAYSDGYGEAMGIARAAAYEDSTMQRSTPVKRK